MRHYLNSKRRSYVLTALILVAMVSHPAMSTSVVSQISWWQTSCDSYGTGDSRVVSVEFRHFPVTESNVDDKGERRIVEFDKKGIGVRVGVGAEGFAVKAANVKNVTVQPLGALSTAMLLTVTSNRGIVAGGPLGGVELTCWREIESMVEQYRGVKILGSPPKPRIPLRDSNGNVIPE